MGGLPRKVLTGPSSVARLVMSSKCEGKHSPAKTDGDYRLGVIGLTSAARLLRLGFAIGIYSREMFSQTTSMAAGAYWWPHKAYPEGRVSPWAKETYEECRKLKADSRTGITFEKYFRFCFGPDENTYALNLVDEWQAVTGTDHGIPCAEA